MEIKLAEKQIGHLMTDLGIKLERCEELCTAIQDSIESLHNEGHSKLTQAQIIQHALKHARNDNEAVFISVTAGEYHARYEQFMQGIASGSLGDILSALHSRMAARN